MKLLLILSMFAGLALADGKSDAEAAVAAGAAGAAKCRAAGVECTVSASYAEIGWLWKNGVPVNNTTVTVTAKVPAPKPQQPVIIYPPAFLFPPQVIVVSK